MQGKTRTCNWRIVSRPDPAPRLDSLAVEHVFVVPRLELPGEPLSIIKATGWGQL